MSSWVTWVRTLVVALHELAFHRLQTMNEIVSWRERRVHAVFCFFAVNEILMCEVTGQPLLNQFANHC